jgi:cellulose synthase/poly-beta-1,6-N-acetylglucosamine synthase-like glycosyltransferase
MVTDSVKCFYLGHKGNTRVSVSAHVVLFESRVIFGNIMLDFVLIKEGLAIWHVIVIYAFLIPVTALNIYQFHKLVNIVRALWATRFFTDEPKQGGFIPEGEEPEVTIQICVYNEAAVVKKTIDAACQVDWPKDKLFIQVLDDSTDGTSRIIEQVAEEWRAKNVNCRRLTRPNRVGYKAGNLASHTRDVRGAFVALFDADHICENKYLRRAIPQFFNADGTSCDRLALVQTPWAYYNTHQNLIAEYESLTLDYSHVVDQVGRSSALQVFAFNGTGGVWRNSAIEAAGGWKWDTVTEDLDISYLVHLAGYEFVYLRDIPQQLEIPAGIRALRKQKHRWTKGYLQVLRKSLWPILRSRQASVPVKIEAFFHTTMSTLYMLGLFMFILSPIIASFEGFTAGLSIYVGVFPFVVHILGLTITIYAKVPSSNCHYKGVLARTMRLSVIPVQFVLSMGMSVFESAAIIDGCFSDDVTFHRTPKEGINRLSTYLDDDGDDEVVEDIVDGAREANEGSCVRGVLRRLKPSALAVEAIEGLSGLVVACYLIIWTGFLVGVSHTFTARLFAFCPLLPAAGLLYMHVLFVVAIAASRYRTHQAKAREAANICQIERDPGSGPSDSDVESQTGTTSATGRDFPKPKTFAWSLPFWFRF